MDKLKWRKGIWDKQYTSYSATGKIKKFLIVKNLTGNGYSVLFINNKAEWQSSDINWLKNKAQSIENRKTPKKRTIKSKKASK